jgi:hypothetical protein
MSHVALSRVALKGAMVSAALLLAAACGSAGSSPAGGRSSGAPASPRTAPPTPVLTVCQDVTTMRAALHSLTTVSITQGAVSEIKAAGRAIQTSLGDLSATAGTEWRAQIDNLRSSVANLQSAADDYKASPSSSGRSKVGTAIGAVAADGRRLLTAIGNRCPSPSPSPASRS